ncbi:MAG: hypothetical protein ACK5BO_05430, partial [Bacteroidota bacterium]
MSLANYIKINEYVVIVEADKGSRGAGVKKRPAIELSALALTLTLAFVPEIRLLAVLRIREMPICAGRHTVLKSLLT